MNIVSIAYIARVLRSVERGNPKTQVVGQRLAMAARHEGALTIDRLIEKSAIFSRVLRSAERGNPKTKVFGLEAALTVDRLIEKFKI
jgi:hypothetical protein